MKKVLLILLAVIVIIGALAGAGFWGYRMGYANGATGSDNGPFFSRSFHMDPSQMPFHRGNEGFNHGFDQRSMMQPGGYHGYAMGYGYFSPLRALWHIANLALVVWFVYWLFTKSGWKITRTTPNDPESTGN